MRSPSLSRLRFSAYAAVALLLTALVPLSVLTALQLTQIDRNRAAVEHEQARQTTDLAREVSRYIQAHQRAVVALAHRFASQPPPNRNVRDALLATIHEAQSGFRGIYLLDPAGRMTAAYPPERERSPIGSDYSDRPYFQQTVRLQAPVVSTIRNGRNITRELLVVLTVPVLDEQQRLVAVVMAPLALQSLWSMIESREFGHGAHAVVSDATGNAVFFPGIGLDGVPLSIANEQVFTLAREQTRGQTSHHSHIDGESVFTTYEELEPLGWQVWISAPTARLEEAQRRALGSARTLMLVVALATMAIGALLARLSSATMANLLEAIERLGRSEPAPTFARLRWAPHELQELVQRFREMSAQVERSRGELVEANRSLAALLKNRTTRLEGKLGEMDEIARLLALPAGGRESAPINATIERFRVLLDLESLRLQASLESSGAADDPLDAHFAVASDTHCFGYLQARGRVPFSIETVASLAQLASSLAVVLNVRRLFIATREQSQTMYAVFESMSDALLMVSASGVVRIANARAADLLGIARDDLIGLRWQRLLKVARRRWPSAEEALRDLIRSQATQVHLIERRGAKIQDEWLAQVFAVHDGAGSLLGRACLLRDITRNAEMERLKDALISVAAHEFKTPVTALTVSLGTLAREDARWPAAFRQEVIEQMQRDTLRLRQLIADWLDISRIEAGMLQLEIEEIDLPSLVAEIVRELSARERFELTSVYGQGATRVWADRSRLRQVLLNLVSNAIRYTDGEAVIVFETRVTGEALRIAVSDQGIGIAPELKDRVFDRFYQADMTATRRRGGTGLGLAIAHGIVAAHGGCLSVTSEPGQGSTFFIDLPREALRPL